MLDEFYSYFKDLEAAIDEYNDLRIRKNFTNAVNECTESLESAMNVAANMYMHDFFSFEEYNKFSTMAISAHIKYLNFITTKLPD